MKLEIYRFELCGKYTEYMTFLDGVLLGANSIDTPTQIEDTDKVVINMVLHNLANNIDKVITRIINHPDGIKDVPMGNCIYSSSNDKVLKELSVKQRIASIQEDFT